jgi:hypothetical protein
MKRARKPGPAVRIKHVAGFRFIEYRPNLQTLTQLPATTVQHGAAPQELGWLALVFSAFGEKVNGLLAGHFQTDRFESGVHGT